MKLVLYNHKCSNATSNYIFSQLFFQFYIYIVYILTKLHLKRILLFKQKTDILKQNYENLDETFFLNPIYYVVAGK